MRHAATLAVALALGLMLAGCGGPEKEPPVDLDARPTLAAIEDEYAAMVQEMTDALDETVGTGPWQTNPDTIQRSRAACQEDPHGPGTSAGWAPLFSEAVPEEADRERATEVVAQVGARHGFGEQRVLRDGPGDLLVVAEDEYGGLYELGIGRRIVLGIRTGCHRDDAAPDAG